MKRLTQLLIVGSLATAGANAAHALQVADENESLSARLLECRAIESALQRLDCYDDISRNVTHTQTHSSTPPARGVEEARQHADKARADAELRRQEARSRADAAREQAQRETAPSERGENPSLRNADDFGREHRRQRDTDDGPHYIEIVEAWQNPYGLWRFRLASGAEWHQLQSGYFEYEEDGRYYIERGMLNSFRLGRDGSNRMIRVRRVD